MKLFIGRKSGTQCKHTFGFLMGFDKVSLWRNNFLFSLFGFLVDTTTFVLNLVLLGAFLFTYRFKDKSNRNQTFFKVNVAAFYGVNIIASIYSYIDAWFIVEFQKASRFQTYGAILWFLYWVNQGVETFYKGEPLYIRYYFYYDMFVIAFYTLGSIVMWVRWIKRLKYFPINDTQFLGQEAD